MGSIAASHFKSLSGMLINGSEGQQTNHVPINCKTFQRLLATWNVNSVKLYVYKLAAKQRERERSHTPSNLSTLVKSIMQHIPMHTQTHTHTHAHIYVYFSRMSINFICAHSLFIRHLSGTSKAEFMPIVSIPC